jgi:hypothetical protein
VKSKAGFCVVIACDYYGEFEAIGEGVKGEDRLSVNSSRWPDGTKIKENQPIIVIWPNGKATEEKLKSRIGMGSAQVDMNGIPDNFSTRTLFFNHDLNGKKIEIPLKGLKFKRNTWVTK